MIVILNGQMMDEKQAVVPVTDHGFLYGIGLFETFRTYGGEPFLLERHFDRMEAGCRQLVLGWSRPDRERAIRLLDEARRAGGWDDVYVRWSVSAGSAPLGLPAGLEGYEHVNEIIYVKPLPTFPQGLYAYGRPLQKLSLPRADSELGPNTPRLKSFHYMNSIAGKREMLSYPWAAGAEGLFLTKEGWLSEGLVSNLCFIRGGTLCTPDSGTGALPGITCGLVLELAQAEGIRAETGYYRWEELAQADEVFVTNSIQELVPITSLWDEHGARTVIGSGAAGPITCRLQGAYRERQRRSLP